MTTRVLFVGENWFGSCARACAYALRRLGLNVEDVDVQTFFPQVRGKPARIARRAFRPLLIAEFNRAIVDAADRHGPDVVLVFKGAEVLPATLENLRADGARLYNYYPDTSAFSHGPLLAQTLPLYDCVFYTKPFWDRDVRSRIPLRRTEFLRHGYDPEVHRPAKLSATAARRYACDVGLIATHMPHKERTLDALLRLRPDLDLRIWGNGWERATSAAVRAHVVGQPLNGTTYAEAIGAIRINLGIMSGRVAGSSQGDEVTTRTFEIPACGGFMLHERTSELAELFEEDREVVCYGSVEELAQKIDHYLADPAARARIAAAGHARCVPAYSYDERMRALLAWHEANGKR